jgi:hypothetical protein
MDDHPNGISGPPGDEGGAGRRVIAPRLSSRHLSTCGPRRSRELNAGYMTDMLMGWYGAALGERSTASGRCPATRYSRRWRWVRAASSAAGASHGIARGVQPAAVSRPHDVSSVPNAKLALRVLVQGLVTTDFGGCCLGLGVADYGLGLLGDLIGGGRRVEGERIGERQLAATRFVLDFGPLAVVCVSEAHSGIQREDRGPEIPAP